MHSLNLIYLALLLRNVRSLLQNIDHVKARLRDHSLICWRLPALNSVSGATEQCCTAPLSPRIGLLGEGWRGFHRGWIYQQICRLSENRLRDAWDAWRRCEAIYGPATVDERRWYWCCRCHFHSFLFLVILLILSADCCSSVLRLNDI